MDQSQAQIFATEYAKNTATGMLEAIRRIGRRAGHITKIALGVSMPHQIGYILALAWPHMKWAGVSEILESVTMVLLAVAVPIATDLLILNCVETIGAAAASKASKARALGIIIIPVGASGTVNFLAPAPLLIKILAAFIVTMIPMGESLRFIRPDFAKVEAMEVEVAAQIERPAAGRKLSDEEKAARAVTREWNRYARMTAGQRRKYREEHGGQPPMPQKLVRRSVPTSPGHGPVNAPSAAELEDAVR